MVLNTSTQVLYFVACVKTIVRANQFGRTMEAATAPALAPGGPSGFPHLYILGVPGYLGAADSLPKSHTNNL